MAITPVILDGNNTGFRLTAPDTSVDVFSLDVVSGSLSSAYLPDEDLRVLAIGRDELFSLVPVAERAAGALGLLTRLVSVVVADGSTLSLSAVNTAGTVWALRASVAAAPANLIAHVTISNEGGLNAQGSNTAGGGGGGAPSGAAGGVLGYPGSTYPDPSGLAGQPNGPILAGPYEIDIASPNENGGNSTLFVLMQPCTHPNQTSALAVEGSHGADAVAAHPATLGGTVTVFAGLGGNAFAQAVPFPGPDITQIAAAGGDFAIGSGAGGNAAFDGAVDAASAPGGLVTIAAGAGGAGALTQSGSAGGSIDIYTGTGGFGGTDGAGGAGGLLRLLTGNGGSAGSNILGPGGVGGSINILAGNGGAGSPGAVSGDGGYVSIAAGVAGADNGGGLGQNGGMALEATLLSINAGPALFPGNSGATVSIGEPNKPANVTRINNSLGLYPYSYNVDPNPAAAIPSVQTFVTAFTLSGLPVTLTGGIDTPSGATADGRLIYIMNVSAGGDDLIIQRLGTNIRTPGGLDITLQPGGVAVFIYRSSAWYLVSSTPSNV